MGQRHEAAAGTAGRGSNEPAGFGPVSSFRAAASLESLRLREL